jgi:catechol 2,3-dioxygenase-like lactoylglutathione lyase family enzyme
MRLSHRLLLASLVTLSTGSLAAQGRCIRAYGTPACNTDSIPAVFARTGWRTTALDHIRFKVADPATEAAFYTALMGWRVRSETPQQVVMDMGDWGSAVFVRTPADSFPASAAGRGNRAPTRALVDGLAFDIEPWNTKAVEAALTARGLKPVAIKSGAYEAFRITEPDGFSITLGNGKGLTAQRAAGKAKGTPSAPLPFAATGWNTVWLDHLSFGATNYKKSVSFFVNLLGWGPTYDEGSQNELMIGDVGDIIVRGGNPLDPEFGKGPGRRGGAIDHISFGISPWDTDAVKDALTTRGLPSRVDTSDGMEIHAAQYKSYHTTTPNGFDLQISYNTHDTRLNLAIAVNPRRPGNK